MQAVRTFGLAVAGGGTGGHIFPGLAVAREFRRREPGTRVLYLGAAGRLEERVVPREGPAVRFHGLRVRGLKGQGPLGAITALTLAASSVGELPRLDVERQLHAGWRLPGFTPTRWVIVGRLPRGSCWSRRLGHTRQMLWTSYHPSR